MNDMKKTKFFAILASSLLTLTACGDKLSTSAPTGSISTPITNSASITNTTPPSPTTSSIIDSTTVTTVPPITPTIIPTPPSDRIVLDTSAPKELGEPSFDQSGLADFAKTMASKITIQPEGLPADEITGVVEDMVDSLFVLGAIQEKQAQEIYKLLLASPIAAELFEAILVSDPGDYNPLNDPSALAELVLGAISILEAEQISAIIVGFTATFVDSNSVWSDLPGFAEEHEKEDSYLKFREKALNDIQSQLDPTFMALFVPIARYLKAVAAKVETLTLKEMTSIQNLLGTLMDGTATIPNKIDAVFSLLSVSLRFLPSNESLSYIMRNVVTSFDGLINLQNTQSLIASGSTLLDSAGLSDSLSVLIEHPEIVEQALLFCYYNQGIVTEKFISEVVSIYEAMKDPQADDDAIFESIYKVVVNLQKEGDMKYLDGFASLLSVINKFSTLLANILIPADVEVLVKMIMTTKFADLADFTKTIKDFFEASSDLKEATTSHIMLHSYASIPAPAASETLSSDVLRDYLLYRYPDRETLMSFTAESITFSSSTLETALGHHYIDATMRVDGDQYHVTLPYFIYPTDMGPVIPTDVHALFSFDGSSVESVTVTFYNPTPDSEAKEIVVTPENFEEGRIHNGEAFYVLDNGYFYLCHVTSSSVAPQPDASPAE